MHLNLSYLLEVDEKELLKIKEDEDTPSYDLEENDYIKVLYN